MKKFINDPAAITAEMLEGLALAYPDIVALEQGNLVVNKKLPSADRVTIVALGGTGHEPAPVGFVGEGMVDIAVAGDVFASPGPQACLEAVKMAERGHGVLLIVLNHTGDMLTGNIVMQLALKQGINVQKVVVQDDISEADKEHAGERRGLAGCVPLYKIAGAAAAAGKSLTEVAAAAQRFADNMASLAVAAVGFVHPVTGSEMVHIEEGSVLMGVGADGEGGILQPMEPAALTVGKMLEALLQALEVQSGEKLLVIVSGSGATTLMEQLIVFRSCCHYLADKGIEAAAGKVGAMFTVQEMAGFQLFIARMDDELMQYWQAPCRTPYYNN